MSPLHRVRACLGFTFEKVSVFLEGTHNIYTKISADTVHFPAPNPSMPAYLDLVESVRDMQPAVASRTKGAAAFRQTKTNLLITGTEQLVTYVQGIADTAQPDEAAGIVVAAGMKVVTRPTFSKVPLELIHGQTAGTIVAIASPAHLIQPSRKVRVFNWRFSMDAGKSWVLAPPTGVAKTTFSGLTPLTTVTVCVAVTLGSSPMGEWSQPVSSIVL